MFLSLQSQLYNLMHPSNILLILAFSALNEDKLRVSKEEHPLNILSIEVTFSVLNEDKLRVVNEEQQKNISCKLITFFVLNEDKLSVFKEEHP